MEVQSARAGSRPVCRRNISEVEVEGSAHSPYIAINIAGQVRAVLANTQHHIMVKTLPFADINVPVPGFG